jgi:hypothetical protein
MRKAPIAALAVLAVLVAFVPASVRKSVQVSPEVRAKAAGIIAALEKIEADGKPSSHAAGATPQPAPGSRSLTFTEPEFNAYIACWLADENEPFVRLAEFKLLAGNKYEGHIAIDLGKPQASGLVPQKQDLLFAGTFETREGQIKVALDKLFIGAQAISPAFVDLIIEVASRLQGVRPTTLKDWYDLPPGVLRLETQPGRVVVIY